MSILDINPLAVVVAAVAQMALGFVWYGPLFGNVWMQARGVTREQMAGVSANQAYGVTTVMAVATALAMAMVLSAASAHSLAAGILLGAIVGAGFVATSSVSNGVFEQRPWVVTLLYAGYQIVGSILMGAIIGVWR